MNLSSEPVIDNEPIALDFGTDLNFLADDGRFLAKVGDRVGARVCDRVSGRVRLCSGEDSLSSIDEEPRSIASSFSLFDLGKYSLLVGQFW
jgi:hypothetical protein